jgi:FMN-dependent NADH-azoreductase
VYLVIAMGGIHEEGVTDHIRPYLRTMLGFLGMTDITMIVADGLAMGEETRTQGLQNARRQIETLLAEAQSAHDGKRDVAIAQEQAA